MEPGTPLPSTSAHVSRPGRRSAPPGNALAPPTVSIPTYPSSTLNNYYQQNSPFIRNDQNVMQAFEPLPLNFYDLPPSASQSRIPSLRRTPSTLSHPNSGHRNSRSSPVIDRQNTSLSPLIFQPPVTPLAQPRRHSIFSPQVINSPLPTAAYTSTFPAHVQTPIAPFQPVNVIVPQPLHPVYPLNQNFSPSNASNFVPLTPASTHRSSAPKPTLKISLPSTKDIPLLTGKHDWGPWHSAVSSLVLCSNLLGHIADDLLPGAAYDPDLWPTYPPVLQQTSSEDERVEFSNWWTRDGAATHILISRLSPSVLGSLPVPNLRLAQRRSAREVYRSLRSNYGAGDYSAVMIIEAKL